MKVRNGSGQICSIGGGKLAAQMLEESMKVVRQKGKGVK